MTTYAMWQMACEGKPSCGSCLDATGETAKEAREYARAAGWKRRKRNGKKVDLCPDCAEGWTAESAREEERDRISYDMEMAIQAEQEETK